MYQMERVNMITNQADKRKIWEVMNNIPLIYILSYFHIVDTLAKYILTMICRLGADRQIATNQTSSKIFSILLVVKSDLDFMG